MFIQKQGDMTTLTSHSLPLIPLRSSISLFSKRIDVNEEICPINGVESALPRSLIRLPSPKEEQEMSPQNCYASENSQSNSICDIDTRLMNGSEPRSSSASSHKGIDNSIMHNDDDYMNYASDDSELSVGKEIVDDVLDSRRTINNSNDAEMESSSVAMANSATAAAAFRLDDISSLDRTISSYYQTAKHHPNVVRPSPTRQEEFLRKTHLYAEEIMKHQINFMTVTKGLNISPLSPLSPIRLGDNNQTQYKYPMPHRNSLSPIHNAAINKPLKIGFDCLPAYANDSDLGKKWSVIEERSARSPEGTHFREIHSHLNAISKITSALGRETNNRLQMASPICTASRESSQSPPTSNSTTNMRHMLHNTFNETNLKFSIDNILKPSFGRRITDPLLKRQKPMRKSAASHRTSISNSDRINKTAASIDSMTNLRLSMPNNNKLSMDQTIAPKLLNQLSKPMNSNGSNKEPVTTSATDKSSTTPSQSTVNSPTSDANSKGAISWPAWVYCTRYSDRPSSGRSPRARRPKKPTTDKTTNDEKRPRTAFSGPQLARLKNEFAENRYLTERRRQHLSSELGLNEAQIKIWFQNKRAKIKKSSGQKNPLAIQLMAQGLYNHSTIPLTREEEELQEMQERANEAATAKAGIGASEHEDNSDDDDDDDD